MAIYKPTDCNPFNGTFDIAADLPIIFECKVDTSNTVVTGYSIEIYDSNNNLIFPTGEKGPIESNVTYLSDLRTYFNKNFSYYVTKSRNVNSGLNGTYIEIPFYVKEKDKADNSSTVSRNQMSENSTPKLVDGQTYTWKITLYQEVENGTQKTFPPAEEKFYDMTVTNGTVIGSNEKRIQTALIDSDDRVVDNLVLLDKFVQPIKIGGLSGYDPINPVTSWTGTVPTTFTMTRSLITGYDSTYGYVYPSTAADNAFAEGQIVSENVNGFQIFKNGNDPANLGATDMVSFIYDEDHFKGTKTWKTTPAKPELSYWEQVYVTDGNPNGVYYPFEGETYGKYPFSGEERIIFNKIQSSKVVLDGNYYGSPYNGIFRPQFSSKEAVVLPPGEYNFKENLSLKNIGDQSLDFIVLYTDQGGPTGVGMKVTDSQLFYNVKDGDSIKTQEVYSEKKWIGPYNNKTIRIDRAQTVTKDFFDWFANNVTTQIEESSSYGVIVTVIWNRVTDASNWGTLSNKIVYCNQDGKNYEINTATQIGEINKTPFKFVEEKPIKIFNTTKLRIGEDPKEVKRIDGNSCSLSVDSISSLSSVTLDGVDVTKNCIFEIGQNNIIYTSSSVLPENLDFKVTYVPYVYQDYTGIIFYNKQATPDSDTGIIYIRPSININKSMIFKEVTTTADQTWFNINYFNKDYNYITYTGRSLHPSSEDKEFSPEIDKTRYQIKSFYKDSDYNPFSIYKNPEIASYLIINGKQKEEALKINGETNEVGARNFSVVAEYIQNSYISWKNYQWILYDAKKRAILEKTDEKYSGEITGTFYGLERNTSYILSLVLQTNTGKIIEIDYVLQTNFEESGAKPNIVAADFDCDTLAMKATVNLENTIIAPEADKYLSSTKNGTTYYYDKSVDFYTKDGSGIASVKDGILTITGNNSLDFQRSFAGYNISDSTQSADIQINSDQIVVEGSFSFSENYQGDIFSLTNDDSGASVRINVPAALENTGSDGLVKLSDDIDKIGANGSYLKIYGADGESSFEWQNASDFHNTSIWKEDDKTWSFGNRINVANFKYAEIHRIDKSIIPYPYEEGEEIEAEDGTKIFWNQLRKNNSIMGSGMVTTQWATIGNVTGTPIKYGHKYYVSLWAKYGNGNTDTGQVFFKLGNMKYGEFALGLEDLKEDKFSLYEKVGTLILNIDKDHGDSSAFQKYSDSTQTLSLEWKNLQIFDLTLMFGYGNEPNNVDEFWNYFSNKFYNKNTYLNINGPYNSYDNEKPLKNPMNPGKQSVKFSVQNQPNSNTSEYCVVDGDSFQINEPDRLIWLDYTPAESQKAVVVNANSVDGVTTVTTQPMTVMKDEPLKWNDDFVWKDGIYVESGFPKTLIGQISINGVVVKTDYLNAIEPITYSNSGLTKQKQVDEKISERNAISNYNFAFRIFINTNTFSVDTINSYCYVTKKPQEGRMKH